MTIAEQWAQKLDETDGSDEILNAMCMDQVDCFEDDYGHFTIFLDGSVYGDDTGDTFTAEQWREVMLQDAEETAERLGG